MREIKFRFWSLVGVGMSPPISLKELLTVYPEWTDLAFENAEVMQFTGLKDKNGKEIYEGDIIKILYESFFGTVGDIEKVEYRASQGGGASWLPFGDGEYGNSPENCEVIGNIWENGELLK